MLNVRLLQSSFARNERLGSEREEQALGDLGIPRHQFRVRIWGEQLSSNFIRPHKGVWISIVSGFHAEINIKVFQ